MIASILLALLVLLASPTQNHLIQAADADKENEVRSILEHMERQVLYFRNEVEYSYNKRCETSTLASCSRNNLNDCTSTFPNQQCMEADELVISACGDGAYCNGLWDKKASTISLPTAVANGPSGNPSDPEVIETACYSLKAEQHMVDQYVEDEEYWTQYNVQPSWRYVGFHNGLFRRAPAIHQKMCGKYDPRQRPWYIAASSGPKDVVLVIDTSGSMDNGRIDLAKQAAITVVQTLTVADRVAVVQFSSQANLIGGNNMLIRATRENKKHLIDDINSLRPTGATNFYAAFDKTFRALESTIASESTSGCNIAVLFMTDGEISEGPTENAVVNLVNERTEFLATRYQRKTVIFTFSLGTQADHEVTKRIACATNGIWTPVDEHNGGDLVGAMSSYYKLFALGLGEAGNEDFTGMCFSPAIFIFHHFASLTRLYDFFPFAAWAEPYEFANPAGKTGMCVVLLLFSSSSFCLLLTMFFFISRYNSLCPRLRPFNVASSLLGCGWNRYLYGCI